MSSNYNILAEPLRGGVLCEEVKETLTGVDGAEEGDGGDLLRCVEGRAGEGANGVDGGGEAARCAVGSLGTAPHKSTHDGHVREGTHHTLKPKAISNRPTHAACRHQLRSELLDVRRPVPLAAVRDEHIIVERLAQEGLRATKVFAVGSSSVRSLRCCDSGDRVC